MKLSTEDIVGSEIFHYFDGKTVISSICNQLKIEHGESSQSVTLPLSWVKGMLSSFRMVRRILRTDKSVFYPVFSSGQLDAVIGVYQKDILRIDWPTMVIRKTGEFRQGRVPLHQSICETEKGNIYIGEYSSNTKNLPVPVWRSRDRGQSWEVAFEFDRDKARHVHGCFWDRYEKKIWICTGDKNGECQLISTDEDFNQVIWFGNGTQLWRTCHLIFRENHVIWGMDSPLDSCYINKFDRKTRELKQLWKVSGPVWYAKDLSDGWMLFASSVEGGPGEEDRYARIYATQDELNLYEVYKIKKDRWPVLFKSGVVAFASGEQDSSRFYMFGEALMGMDGKVLQGSIQPSSNQQSSSQMQWLAENESKIKIEFSIPSLQLFQEFRDKVDSSLPVPMVEFDEPDQEPALKNLSLSVIEILQRGCLEKKTPSWVFKWSDKLLRVCELNRQQLECKIINSAESKDILKIKTLRICLFFLSIFAISNDARYVNMVLKIVDMQWFEYNPTLPKRGVGISHEKFLEVMLSVHLNSALNLIESPTWRTEIVLPEKDRVVDDFILPMCCQFETPPKVVVFSPNPYGLITLCVCELLKIHGIEVKGVVVRRLLNFKRLIMELKRDGFKWVFKKVVYKLLFRKAKGQQFLFLTLPQYYKQLNMSHENVSTWSKDNNCDLITCNELNDSTVHDYLNKTLPDMVIFCGGGLITEQTIHLSGAGVLNCHGGVLPRYRGLDVVEWAILEKHPDLAGITTHFMSRYVDEGNVLAIRKINIRGIQELDDVNSAFEAEHVKFIVYSIIKYFQKGIEPASQEQSDGKQYFYMHPKLVGIVKNYLITANQ